MKNIYSKPKLFFCGLAQTEMVSADFGEPFNSFTGNLEGGFNAITSYSAFSGTLVL